MAGPIKAFEAWSAPPQTLQPDTEATTQDNRHFASEKGRVGRKDVRLTLTLDTVTQDGRLTRGAEGSRQRSNELPKDARVLFGFWNYNSRN